MKRYVLAGVFISFCVVFGVLRLDRPTQQDEAPLPPLSPTPPSAAQDPAPRNDTLTLGLR
ncbi:MAG: hypothetical protein ACYTGH_00980 [Planctomycetota bacterium]